MNYVIVLFLFSKNGKFMFKYVVLNEFSDKGNPKFFFRF